jgi:small subunit ribosomal protein S8e
MAIWHGEKGKDKTGGEITLHRKKLKRELGSFPAFTKIGKETKTLTSSRGNVRKLKILSAEFANVFDPKTKSSKKAKILDVLRNPANQHFARRKVITAGAIIKTEIGDARVVSRPGQHGVVNAILVSE